MNPSKPFPATLVLGGGESSENSRNTAAGVTQPSWNGGVNNDMRVAAASPERDARLMPLVRGRDETSFAMLLQSTTGR